MRLFTAVLIIAGLNMHWGWYLALAGVWVFTKLWAMLIAPALIETFNKYLQLTQEKRDNETRIADSCSIPSQL